MVPLGAVRWLAVSVAVAGATSSSSGSSSGSTFGSSDIFAGQRGSHGNSHGPSYTASQADIDAVRASLPGNGTSLRFPVHLNPFFVRDCRFRAKSEVLTERSSVRAHE
jgi:hypothetical protein